MVRIYDPFNEVSIVTCPYMFLPISRLTRSRLEIGKYLPRDFPNMG
jgi:hypothetical protein